MGKRIVVAVLGILLGGLVGWALTMLTGPTFFTASGVMVGGVGAVVWTGKRQTTIRTLVDCSWYLAACLTAYLLCWFVCYCAVINDYGRVDYSYLFEWFWATWFDTAHFGEMPAIVWGLSCILYLVVLFPTFLIARRLLKLRGAVCDRRSGDSHVV